MATNPTPSNPSEIDRRLAAKINPLISDTNTEDTLARATILIKDLAVNQSTIEEGGVFLPLGQMSCVLDVIAAAFDFEKDSPSLSASEKDAEGE